MKKLQILLPSHIKYDFVGLDNKQPVWGEKYYQKINNSKILINLSRGSYKKHYSSDRISTLIGNGCFVLNEQENKYYDFFNNKNELINFKNEKDLKDKILYYLLKPELRNKIAFNSYKKYHKEFNTKKIIEYMLDIILNKKIKNKYLWS